MNVHSRGRESTPLDSVARITSLGSMVYCASGHTCLSAADDANYGGDLLETVQETQNDEEEQAMTGSQVSVCACQGQFPCI